VTADLAGAAAAWFAYVALFAFAMWQKLRRLANIAYLDVLSTLVLFGGLFGLALGALGKEWGVWGTVLGPILGAHYLEWAVKRKAKWGGFNAS